MKNLSGQDPNATMMTRAPDVARRAAIAPDALPEKRIDDLPRAQRVWRKYRQTVSMTIALAFAFLTGWYVLGGSSQPEAKQPVQTQPAASATPRVTPPAQISTRDNAATLPPLTEDKTVDFFNRPDPHRSRRRRKAKSAECVRCEESKAPPPATPPPATAAPTCAFGDQSCLRNPFVTGAPDILRDPFRK